MAQTKTLNKSDGIIKMAQTKTLVDEHGIINKW